MKRPDFHLQGVMTPSIKITALASIIILLVEIGGCASTDDIKMTPEERAQISKVDVQESHGGLSSRLGGLLPENAASGFLGGLIGGFIGGFHPYAWWVGGPIMVSPVLGVAMAACGAAVSEVEDPSVQLQNFANDTGLQGFRKQLDLRLQEISALWFTPANSGEPADIIFDIQEITIVLDGDPPQDGFVCRPTLSASARWQVIRAIDGQQLAHGTTTCATPTSTKTFKEWFAESTERHDDIRSLLEKLGRQVAHDLFSDMLDKPRSGC